MPIYTYKCSNKDCDKHNQEFEVVMKITEDNLTTCPVCGEGTLRKVIKPVGVTLKGGGWAGPSRRY